MLTFGSVCSGIEASQLAFSKYNFNQLWSSEIAEFPNKVLAHHYPFVKNIGDMNDIEELIKSGKIEAPDLFCGGTPCQAFSLAGWKNGLQDERGQLTITFFKIANTIDEKRNKEGKKESIILWENVEGVLNDKTNAFGNFIAGLAGFDNEIKVKKWAKAGYIEGPLRNVAWRVLDSKYFGLPQQRKRLYVLAGGKSYRPDVVLFEESISNERRIINNSRNIQYKEGNKFEFFREYTDCLYAAYGTKWNGNAAAYNGSLFVSQNDRLRRFTPLECERLMGIPDNYTNINGQKPTNRYQAIGNSWAVPVIEWIGKRISLYEQNKINKFQSGFIEDELFNKEPIVRMFSSEKSTLPDGRKINTSVYPNTIKSSSLIDIVETCPDERYYISPRGCAGILRRTEEKGIKINPNLKEVLLR